MENERLRGFLRLVISNILLERIKVEIDYPSAQFSDPEKLGMVSAYTEVSDALGNLLDEELIKPSLGKLFDKWFDTLNCSNESSSTRFEIGYTRALRSSIGDMEYLLDE